MSVDLPSAAAATPLEAAGPSNTPSTSPSGGSLGEQLRSGSIVVAVSGDDTAAPPVRVAAALERRYGSQISAVQVLDTSDLPLLAPLPSVFTLARELIGDAPYADDAKARRQQFSGWLGEPNTWPVHIAVGAPASEIERYAERQGAALIVMGLRRHGVVDRVLRDETTLTVARRARRAVLGITPSLSGLPRRGVVGVDFGPASMRAARAALDVLAAPTSSDASVLRLVFVDRNPNDGSTDDPAGEQLIRQLGVQAAFDQLVRELAVPPGIQVDCVTRHGAPAIELLACADQTQADLIAVGSYRHERLERWILGSVTTEVVRDGRCSVLIIPPSLDG